MAEQLPRIVVSQPGSRAAGTPWLETGLFPWKDSPHRLTLVVKATFSLISLGPNQFALTPSRYQQPLRLSPEESAHLAGSETDPMLSYPGDFDERKLAVDIVLASGRVRNHAPVRMRVANHDDVVVRRPDPDEPTLSHAAAHFKVGFSAMRTEALPSDSALALESRDGEAVHGIALPGLGPALWMENIHGQRAPLTLLLDTVWLHPEGDEAVLAWRNEIQILGGPQGLKRLIVTLAPTAQRPNKEALDAALPTGHHGFALRRVDLINPTLPNQEELARVQALYDTYGDEEPTGEVSDDTTDRSGDPDDELVGTLRNEEESDSLDSDDTYPPPPPEASVPPSQQSFVEGPTIDGERVAPSPPAPREPISYQPPPLPRVAQPPSYAQESLANGADDAADEDIDAPASTAEIRRPTARRRPANFGSTVRLTATPERQQQLAARLAAHIAATSSSGPAAPPPSAPPASAPPPSAIAAEDAKPASDRTAMFSDATEELPRRRPRARTAPGTDWSQTTKVREELGAAGSALPFVSAPSFQPRRRPAPQPAGVLPFVPTSPPAAPTFGLPPPSPNQETTETSEPADLAAELDRRAMPFAPQSEEVTGVLNVEELKGGKQATPFKGGTSPRSAVPGAIRAPVPPPNKPAPRRAFSHEHTGEIDIAALRARQAEALPFQGSAPVPPPPSAPRAKDDALPFSAPGSAGTVLPPALVRGGGATFGEQIGDGRWTAAAPTGQVDEDTAPGPALRIGGITAAEFAKLKAAVWSTPRASNALAGAGLSELQWRLLNRKWTKAIEKQLKDGRSELAREVALGTLASTGDNGEASNARPNDMGDEATAPPDEMDGDTLPPPAT